MEGTYIKNSGETNSTTLEMIQVTVKENNVYENAVSVGDEDEALSGLNELVPNQSIDITGLNETIAEHEVNQNKTDGHYFENKVDYEGEEQTDIGLKDLPLTGAPNVYVGKRNFIHQLMDVALLMANVSQLKALLSIDHFDKYFYPLLVFIILSISLQVVFTVTMLLIWSIEKGLEERTVKAHKPSDKASVQDDNELKAVDEKKKVLADRLDKFGNVLVLSIIVSNVFITGFGVEPHGTSNSSANNG